MTTVTLLQHEPAVAPGTLPEAIRVAGGDVQIIEAWHEADWKLADTDVLVVLGGTMNAYDDAKFPHLTRVKEVLRLRTANGQPTVGICLGHQLLAVALGGEVAVGADAGPEKGSTPIAFEAEPPFSWRPGLVFEDHSDAVSVLPEGAKTWARSGKYVQIFSVNRSFGLQFHPEVDLALLEKWYEDDPEGELPNLREDYLANQEGLLKLGRAVGAWLVSLAG